MRVLKEAAARAADDRQPLHRSFRCRRTSPAPQGRSRGCVAAARQAPAAPSSASSGTVMGSMLPYPAAALGEGAPSPASRRDPASTSLTPPSAASRFVCIQMAEMPVFHQLIGPRPARHSFLSGAEDDRVVGHDERAQPLPGRFLHHLGGDVQRHQDPGRSRRRNPPAGRGCPSSPPAPAAQCRCIS